MLGSEPLSPFSSFSANNTLKSQGGHKIEYVYTYIYVCVCMCVYIYVHIYISVAVCEGSA